jgi:hypothetical protein
MAEARFMTWWDPACEEAARVVEKAGKGTPEVLMKGLGVGYCRAAFLLGILRRMGVLHSSASGRDMYTLEKRQARG